MKKLLFGFLITDASEKLRLLETEDAVRLA